MSKYEAKVIPFKKEFLKVHDNADKLAIFCVPDTNFVVCINKTDWLTPEGEPLYDRCVYIEPDTIVDTDRPEFLWLKGITGKLNESNKYRVKAKKLRGVNSFGFLIKLQDDANYEIGTDLWDVLGLEHWNPPEPSGDNGQSVRAPARDFSQYDVENLKKYSRVFEGKEIVATLKIHGQNMRVCFQDEQVYVGSRSFWKADVEGSDFWRSYRSVPTLEKFIKENNHLCVYGESYGNNANFREDCEPGERKFRAFDIFDMSRNVWVEHQHFIDMCERYGIPFCPILYKGEFLLDHLLTLVENDSPLRKGQPMEGAVVSTLTEQWDVKLGRCKAKIVSCRYFESK